MNNPLVFPVVLTDSGKSIDRLFKMVKNINNIDYYFERFFTNCKRSFFVTCVSRYQNKQ